MTTRARSSNFMRPWAWLAAVVAVCLVLASSTALYAINSDVRLALPWWTAVIAPLFVYALVLPLCVRRLRVGPWLIGFIVLAALHVALGMATALLYAQVSFSSIPEMLAPAFWAFPPAVVLEMVGALLVTLPFLSSLAPRAAVPRGLAERMMAEAGAQREKFDLSALPGTTRESWARTAAMKELAVPPTAAATLSADPPPATAIMQESEEPPCASPGEPEHDVHAAPLAGKNGSSVEPVENVTEVASPEDFRDAVRELLGSRGAPSNAHVDEPKPPVVIVPEEPASELTAEAPAWAKAAKTEPLPAPELAKLETSAEPAPPTAPEPAQLEASAEAKTVEPASPTAPEPSKPAPAAAVRIPFDRVVGQLPPGAFRVPLAQLGARLREPETLLVAHSLIVPQLGEGVVQVPWEEVAEQFPAAVLAVPLTEVKERIVNGRLLLPLDQIVRQLPPDVFGALLGRGPVEVPGIESFPAPFKPQAGSAPVASPPAALPGAEPVSRVASATIEAPAAGRVAADPTSAPTETPVAYEEAPAPSPPPPPAPTVGEQPAKLKGTPEAPAPPPPAPTVGEQPAKLKGTPEAPLPPPPASTVGEQPARMKETPEAPVLAPPAPTVGEQPAKPKETLEGLVPPPPAPTIGEQPAKPKQTLEAPAPPPPAPTVDEQPAKLEETPKLPVLLPARVVEMVREPVVESPTIAAPAPALDGEQVRIPFERLLAQLPPAVFCVALDQVGARLTEPGVLLVPQALVVSQLAEGAVYAKWETVAAQFPSTVLAVDPADVRERLAEGRLSLPLDEIIRQLPPDVFGAAMARGPVHVPGIEDFPAPFKPFQPEKSSAAEPPAVGTVSAPAPSVAVLEPSRASLPSSAAPVVEVARPESPRAPFPAVPHAEFTVPVPPRRWPTPVVEVSAPVAPVAAEAPMTESAVTEITPPPVTPMTNIPIMEPAAPVGEIRPLTPAPFPPSQAVADSGMAAESSASETQRAVLDVAEPLETEPRQKPMAAHTDAVHPVPWETPTRDPFVSPAASESEPVPGKKAVVVGPTAPSPGMRDIEPVATPVRNAAVAEPPVSLPATAEIVPMELPAEEAAGLERPAPFPTVRGDVSVPAAPREASLGESPAPLELRDLHSRTPRVSPPVSARERLTSVSPSPQPVPVAPLYEARVFERPVTVEPAPGPSARREPLEKIAALMGPLATVAPDETRVGDFTIISVSTAGIGAGTVAAAAGRLCPIMARGLSQPIEQVTLRGAGGILVLTPLGSSSSGGAMLAVGMRTGGALARLEMLARRAAAWPVDREPPRGTVVFARFDRMPTPPAVVAAAEDLTSFGPLDVQSYREAASGAVVHCLVAPGVAAPELAPFAWELTQVMTQSASAEALGVFHSAVLRSGKTRVEIRKLPAPAGPSQVLVMAGGDTGRPGLVRLQVERTAARLSEA